MFEKKNSMRKTGGKRVKPQNERVKRRTRPGQRHLLEVNPRSKVADRQRMKNGARTGVKLLLCCGLAFAAVAGLKAGADHLFFNNPEIVVEEISVTTDGVLSTAQIVDAAGVSKGDNALLVDLDATRRKVESLPEVISAEVRREIPGGVFITVKERRAVAWLECEGLQLAPFRTRDGCLMTADGVAIPCHSLTREMLRLPVLRIGVLSRVRYGEVVESGLVEKALELVSLNSTLLYEKQLEIRTVEILNPYSMLALFANDAEVTFGMGDISRQVEDFKVVIDNAEKQGWRIATLNLMVEDNVPVTFFSGAPIDFDNGAGGVDAEAATMSASKPEPGRRQSDAKAILGTLY